MANGYQGAEIEPEARTGLNSTGSTIPKGTIVKIAGAGRSITPCTANTDAIYGVTGEDIVDGARGRIVVRGCALVLAGGALTPGARVTASTTGRAEDATTGDSILGLAIEAGAAGVLTEVELAGPSGLPVSSAVNVAAANVSVADAGGLLTATTVEAALAELATSIANLTASDIAIVDAGGLITATDVEGALAELAAT